MDPFLQLTAARRHFAFRQVDEVTGLQAVSAGPPPIHRFLLPLEVLTVSFPLFMPKSSKAAPKKAKPEKNKSLESWIWDFACSIHGAKDAPKNKDFILPLTITKRLCDAFYDKLNRIATEVGSRKMAFQLAKRHHKLIRFCLPLERPLRNCRSGPSSAWRPTRSTKARPSTCRPLKRRESSQ